MSVVTITPSIVSRLLDVGDYRGQGGSDLVDVVVDGSTGQLQLSGDGAHRLTILEDHQDDGGVGGGDTAPRAGLVNGLDGHVSRVWPAAHWVGVRVRDNQTDRNNFLVQLNEDGVLTEATGVSQFDETEGVGHGGRRNPFVLAGAHPEPPQCEQNCILADFRFLSPKDPVEATIGQFTLC